MSITGNGFTGLSLWLSVVGLGAQPPDTGLQIEVHIYNYSDGFPRDVGSGRAGVCQDF